MALPSPIHDERLRSVQQNASWWALGALLVSYLVIGGYFAVVNRAIPVSTQIMFFVAFLTYAYLGMKQDGFAFTIPGMKETEETLNQSTVVRSVPWLMVTLATVAIMLNILTAPQAIRHDSQIFPTVVAALGTILTILITPLLTYYVASEVKRGSRYWIILTLLGSLFGAVDAVHYLITGATGYGSSDIFVTQTSVGATLSLVYFLWIFLVLLFNVRTIIATGKQIPPTTTRKANPEVLRLSGYLVATMPILFIPGFVLILTGIQTVLGTVLVGVGLLTAFLIVRILGRNIVINREK